MMSHVKKLILDNEFKVFRSGFIQDLAVILKRLKTFGITLDEYLEYTEELKEIEIQNVRKQNGQIVEQRRIWKRRAKKCPECGETMFLMNVNNHPRTQIDGDFKSMWYCPEEMNCGYIELNKESREEIIKRRNLNGIS